MRGRGRVAWRVGATGVTATLLAGCAPWVAPNPQFASDSARNPGSATTTSSSAPNEPPAIAAPKNDLTWAPCPAEVQEGAGAPPAGVRLDCADYVADLDPLSGKTESITIGVMRAQSDKTPPQAGPVVFTTGSDVRSTQQLGVWLTRSGADILAQHPIVAVDRRGIGTSSPINCRNKSDAVEMQQQAQFIGGDPVAQMGDLAQSVVTECTDSVSEIGSAYNNAHAAGDLERLRSIWDVPALALIGIGNGAQVAMAYAGTYPNKVARLVLDSPESSGSSAEAVAEDQLKGQQAALTAFAAQCVTINCPLGPDPKAAVASALASARTNRSGQQRSVAQIVAGIVNALGFPIGDRVANTDRLARAVLSLSTPGSRDFSPLIRQAEAMRGSDGQFVSVCSDSLDRPTPDRIRELVVAWGKDYPEFGSVAALNLANCLSWPSGTAAAAPKNLAVNVLLLGGQNDPIAGSRGVSTMAATVINAGATSRRVMWQGTGHGVAIYAPCALPPILDYLRDAKLPASDIFCPA